MFVPLSGGTNLPVDNPLELPGDVFRVASGQSQLTRIGFDGTSITSGPTAVPNGPGWGGSVGAFMLNGTLHTAYSNGNFTKQTFDGTNYGPAILVDTADELVRQIDWHNTDVPSITSLFYYRGNIYFTRSGQSSLYSRGFEPESDIVGQLRQSPPLSPASVSPRCAVRSWPRTSCTSPTPVVSCLSPTGMERRRLRARLSSSRVPAAAGPLEPCSYTRAISWTPGERRYGRSCILSCAQASCDFDASSTLDAHEHRIESYGLGSGAMT